MKESKNCPKYSMKQQKIPTASNWGWQRNLRNWGCWRNHKNQGCKKGNSIILSRTSNPKILWSLPCTHVHTTWNIITHQAYPALAPLKYHHTKNKYKKSHKSKESQMQCKPYLNHWISNSQPWHTSRKRGLWQKDYSNNYSGWNTSSPNPTTNGTQMINTILYPHTHICNRNNITSLLSRNNKPINGRIKHRFHNTKSQNRKIINFTFIWYQRGWKWGSTPHYKRNHYEVWDPD